jgi:sugar phosphate isomerase/epimerase
MKCAVTVNLVPEGRSGPFVFHDDLAAACRAAADLGFDAVEVFAPDADFVNRVELVTLLTETGLAVAAVGTGAGWVRHRLTLTDPDPGVRRQAREFVRSMIQFGAGFGAPAIVGSMQGRWGAPASKDDAVNWLRDALAELGEAAAAAGVPLLFEPLNRYESNLLNTLADATSVLADNVKLLADLFHMNIEEADVAGAIRAAGPLVGHVHFADSNRRAAGGGHTDFRPVISALREVGYAGYLSAEVFPHPDPESAATATVRAFRALTATA